MFAVFEREKFITEMDKEIKELRENLDSNYKDSKDIFQQEGWGVSFNQETRFVEYHSSKGKFDAKVLVGVMNEPPGSDGEGLEPE